MKCPESIEELKELEKLIPLCKVTLFEQAKARIETGAAKSLHEASRQLAEETGRKPETIERAIQREQETKGVTVSPVTSDKFKPLVLNDSEKKVILKEAKSIEKEKREELLKERKETIVAESKAMPEGLFDVILADPPWRYDFSTSTSREVENQYPTMELAELCSLNIPTAENCVLFLWATSPKLIEAIEVMSSWGFSYKTCMVWVKDKIGMGYYARQQHEILLIGTKGNPGTPDPSSRPSSVFEAPRGRHSEKPAIIFELIQAMFPNRRYLELFSRKQREGWESWGNE